MRTRTRDNVPRHRPGRKAGPDHAFGGLAVLIALLLFSSFVSSTEISRWPAGDPFVTRPR
ncbi:MAG: hypothetical protein IT486_04805 [Gammaproteobacteria bacterium]|nr:hypothetical protein [Gammaproteobacteria bacterium]